jgi:hypothetical protein
MSDSARPATHRLGPFPAGCTSAELVAQAGQGELGLRQLDADEQAHEYYKARCQAIEKTSAEFFYANPDSRCLIFEKARDSRLLPEFAEYLFCWFAEDRLCGVILSGVTSDAGTHAQINEQEAALEEHAAEVAEALERKYPERPTAFVNHFNFVVHPTPRGRDGSSEADLFIPFERLVASIEDGAPSMRIEGVCCGPTLISFAGKPHAVELASGSSHSSQFFRQAFASPECLVIYDFKLERYVRTIESIHVYEDLIYISRSLAEDLGRRLNAQHAATVRAEAEAQINEWRTARSRAEEAKRARIAHLVEVL